MHSVVRWPQLWVSSFQHDPESPPGELPGHGRLAADLSMHISQKQRKLELGGDRESTQDMEFNGFKSEEPSSKGSLSRKTSPGRTTLVEEEVRPGPVCSGSS